MVVWLVAGVGWTHAALGTNGIEPIGVSTQARARGGADIAVGDSALSQIDNPASLSLHNAPRFDFSGQICFPTARWSGPVDQSESDIKLVPIANAAVAMPINDRLVVGLALHTKAGLASRYKMQHLMIPFWDRRVVFGFGFS